MPYLLLTLAALFWGGNYVVGHVLVQGVDPILMTEARWALTALLLGLLYRRQIAGSRRLLRANAPAVVVLTLCGQVSWAWLSNFRNTALAPRQCARGARIPYPSQLKD